MYGLFFQVDSKLLEGLINKIHFLMIKLIIQEIIIEKCQNCVLGV